MKKRIFILTLILFSTWYCESGVEAEIKNVILVIADGLGIPELGFGLTYAHLAPNSAVENRVLNIEDLMNQGTIGLALTNPASALIADSAAAASALATGQATVNEALGLDGNGDPVESLIEVAERSGLSTGLITNTKITHGTPAGFIAHLPNRYDELSVALALVDSNIDVLMGGGLSYFLPRNLPLDLVERLKKNWNVAVKGYRRDDRNLIDEFQAKGYQFVTTKEELAAGTANQVLGIFAVSHLPDALTMKTRSSNNLNTVPTLSEMTEKALGILPGNPQGFFLMIEAGQIDFTCHANDAGATLHELLDFDRLLGTLKRWVDKREDTLIVITSDHETGGLTMAYNRYGVPEPKPLQGAAFRGDLFKPSFNYGKVETLDQIYGQKASFEAILEECDDLPGGCTPEKLMEIFNREVLFPITLDEAKEVLEEEDNLYYRSDNYYLKHEKFPAVDDFEAFYVYGRQIRSDLLGRAIGDEQGIAWGAGTHSAAPVLVVAVGPAAARSHFNGCFHQMQIPRIIAEVLRIDSPGQKLSRDGNLEKQPLSLLKKSTGD